MSVVKINNKVVTPVIAKIPTGYYSIEDLMAGATAHHDGNFPTLTNWVAYSLNNLIDPATTTFNAPNLESIGGSATFGDTKITSVSCPQLRSITTMVDLFSKMLVSELEFPNLVLVNISMNDFCKNNALPNVTHISLPSLKSITCKEFLYNLPKLTKVDLSSLEELDATYAFEGLALLEEVDLPNIKDIKASHLFYGATPSLRSVHIGPNIENISPTTLSTLSSVSEDGLVITIDKAEGEIAGAPWGLKDTLNVQIVYNPITE